MKFFWYYFDMNKGNIKILTSIYHPVSVDIREALLGNEILLSKWNNLTPIARNEWICWVTFVKKDETRKEHLERFKSDLLKGKKRPCCWPGCPHRNPKSLIYFQKK